MYIVPNCGDIRAGIVDNVLHGPYQQPDHEQQVHDDVVVVPERKISVRSKIVENNYTHEARYPVIYLIIRQAGYPVSCLEHELDIRKFVYNTGWISRLRLRKWGGYPISGL